MPTFPTTFRIRQRFDAQCVDDIPATVENQLAGLKLADKVQPGQSVAITAGSRGIANIVPITRAVVEHVQRLQAEPFVVPAMGSHGGGTAEGQRQLLERYGLTEQSLACPIRSSMETVEVGRAAEGFPIHFDRHAFEADHVIVVNRVKPHTRFAGPIESGLMKMLLIGLGKCAGARVYHGAIHDYSFEQIIHSVVGQVMRKCPILAGLAIVENAYDETARIEAVLPEEFESREKELLVEAKRGMARLPFEQVDVLLIDRIGKDISGTGLDTNVVGRKFNDHRAVEGETPKVHVIAVRGLTEATHGNAIGMGIAEFCRTDLLREADQAATRLNAITAEHAQSAMAPLDYPTDREMLDAAFQACGHLDASTGRMLWIADTLDLAELECSAAYRAEAEARDDLEVLTECRSMPFSEDGNLPWVRELR